MTQFIMVSDIVEANGKTCKENNLAIEHDIPIGTLVEIIYKSEYEEEEESTYGLRLFVVNHSRDCEGTPLYDMSFDKKAFKEYKEAEEMIEKNRFKNSMEETLIRWTYQRARGAILSNYGRESIQVV